MPRKDRDGTERISASDGAEAPLQTGTGQPAEEEGAGLTARRSNLADA